MYKEPLAPEKVNINFEKRIGYQMEKQVEKIAIIDQDDGQFLINLHGLCVLNKMAESHQGL